MGSREQESLVDTEWSLDEVAWSLGEGMQSSLDGSWCPRGYLGVLPLCGIDLVSVRLF